MNNNRTVIFSDLDGTILDENYGLETTYPTIMHLNALKVPLVLCSSKTRLEIEYFRSKLLIDAPFVSENGATVFIPRGYFKLGQWCKKQTSQYDIVEFGIAYSSIREKLEGIKKNCSCELRGYGDMNVEEIAKDTGLPIELAELAKRREYSEPFRYNQAHEDELLSAIRKEELKITHGGRYYHLMGDHSKGKAVLLLKELYSEKIDQLKTIGVGNSSNDAEMLEAVDEPFFIRKPQEMQSVWQKIVSYI